ncbi:MAG: DUF4347 domain-containing protein [Thiobacillus sp.]|nr:DUF4347 domain-containing protein [Thiobacillus sp.]
MLNKLFRRRPLIEELEPRILYSADLAPFALDSLAPAPEQRIVNVDGEFASVTAATRNELVIVDSGVQDYEALLADILDQAGNDRHFSVVILDSNRDGIEQISDVLKQYGNLDAVHLISHGGPGALQLGSSQLDAASLDRRAAEIAAWSNAFHADADWLIYGCDVAAGAEGESFVRRLGTLTQTDVAGSDDLTGSGALGGDWALEFRNGAIETSVILDERNVGNWQGVLVKPELLDTVNPLVMAPIQQITTVPPLPSGPLGDLVSSLIDTVDGSGRDNFADPDGPGIGIAINGATLNGGKLFYSPDNGANWTELNVGTLSNINSFLLPADATTRIYYQPAQNYTGYTSNLLSIRAWDQSAGSSFNYADTTGGSAGAFSSGQKNIAGQVTVSGANAAPTASSQNVAELYTLNTTLDLTDIVVSDTDSDNVSVTLTLSDAGAGALTTGTSGTTTSSFSAGQWRVKGNLFDVNALLASVSFVPTTGYVSDFSIAVSIADGLAAPVTGVKLMSVNNAAPVVTTTGSALNHTENDPATVVDAGLVVTDAVPGTLTGATVSLTGNYASGQDLLAFTNQLGISGSWDADTGVLTLTGTTSVANYETALRSVTYFNASESPSTLTRTVSFIVNDGTSPSAAATRTVTVAAENDAPVNSVPGAQTTAKNTTLVFSSANGNALSIADVDADSATVETTLTVTGGVLNAAAGTTGVSVTGSGTASVVLSGTLTQINELLAGNQGGLLSYAPTTGFTGSASLQMVTNDLGSTGSGGAQTDTDVISISVTDASLWLSTDGNATSSAGSGNLSWTDGHVVNFGNPNLALGSTTTGTFSSTINLNALANDGNVDIKGLHYVGQDTIVGTTTPITLLAGDVLFSVDGNETFGGLNVTKQDIVLFRPTTPGDFSSGSFQIVLRNPGGTGNDVRDFALVEAATTVGGTALQKGDFLLLLSSGSYDKDVWLFRATTTGTATSGAPLVELVNGDTAGLNLGAQLRGIELITQTTSIGGKTLSPGQLLLSLNGNAFIGGLSVQAGDVAILTLLTSGSLSTGAASMLMRAADVELTGGGETLDALALVQRASVAPTVTVDASLLAYIENDPPTVIAPNAMVADADSINFGGGSLSVYLSSNGTVNDRLAIRNEGVGATQIGVSGSDVTYGGVIIGSYSGGEVGTTPLVVSLNANATVAATQALLRNITYANVSDDPSTLPRTAGIVLTDGSGGVSSTVSRTISVTAANDAPTINGVTASTAINDTGTATPFASAVIGDVDSPAQTQTVSITLDLAAKGSLSNLGGGSYDAGTGAYSFSGTAAAAATAVQGLVFTPTANRVSPGSTESTTFTISVNDGVAPSVTDSGTTVVTTSVNDAPVAVADTASAVEAGGVANGTAGTNPTGNVLTNDTDVDSGDTQTVTAVSFGATPGSVGSGLAGAYGTLTLNADGSYSYVVDNNNAAVQALRSSDTLTETFNYSLQDMVGALDSSTLTITITGSNDAPVITSGGTHVVVGESPATIPVAASDMESDTLGFSISGGADAAWFTIDSSSGLLSLNFVPDYEIPKDANLDNLYEVTVTVSDGNGGAHTLAVQLVVADKVESVAAAPAAPPAPDVPAEVTPDKEADTEEAKPTPPPVVPIEGLPKAATTADISNAGLTVVYQSATAAAPAQMMMNDVQVSRNNASTSLTLVTLNQLLGGLSSDGRALQLLQNSLGNGNFLQQLDQLQDTIRQQLSLDKNVVASTLAVSTGLSVGYVLWLVRGGVLLSSLLTSLPAWRLIDPLPILGYLGKREVDVDEEDDSLESMLNKSNRSAEPVPNGPNEVTP